ncbi:DUF262 domain-containing protein [Paractinoplanes brasiliensis]|uniref:Uncharacterized protein with ParB-like and HNH nuclease domain n=1 Tax=Paractinoplanes brasiliensis TaxID=52695 RepID=A0A4R6JQR9_9ACTN|nr:DUF262 domain-containing protein [Actinoplanes brasiliensis]TDO38953.1 uncharacterized protein with ParB-like and HNH nuclease domain [Actinoplanes brasiliensis]GID33222.1 hypothetical protein Abr02nite_82050 [Actinoplanes brasiliensis]
MLVTSNGRTVGTLLSAGFYKIPRFQRPYSWDRANVEEFWTDVVDSQGDYFIGSMVVYGSGGTFGLVDGQQRLTTITLLLAAVRNSFLALNSEKEAKGIQTMIERVDAQGNTRFVLQAETSHPFLQSHVQSVPGEARREASTTPEERAIEQAFNVLSGKIRSALSAIEANPAESLESKPKAKIAQLIALRDKVLSLVVVLVEVDNEDDATMIFQTLNSRGKDLEVSDLVKSHLLSLLKATNVDLDQARDRWNSILESFAESSADLSMNRFLLHSWLSRHDYVGEKELFKAIKSYVRANNAQNFLDTLSDEAKLYRTAQEPNSGDWKKPQLPVKYALGALMLFRMRQPLPMVLSLLRAYESGAIKLAILIKAMRGIECYHFIATAVTNQPSSGGVSRMYSASARSLLNARTPDGRIRVINELLGKLRDRLPSYAEFEASFLELRSSRMFASQVPLVRYALIRLYIEQHGGEDAPPVDFSQMTIEHLAPQSFRKSGVRAGDVARIGNLTLVSQQLNEELGDKSFAAKRPILARAGVEPEIVAEGKWTAREIEARGKRLAKLAFDNVWTF